GPARTRHDLLHEPRSDHGLMVPRPARGGTASTSVPLARSSTRRRRLCRPATHPVTIKKTQRGFGGRFAISDRLFVLARPKLARPMREVRYDRGPNGHLKAWVCAEWDRVRLRKCADIVQNSFGGEARDRVGGADLVFWDFMVGPVLVTVHLEQHVGIAVMANDA